MNVMQEWTNDLSMMQQSVLLTAIRGPDGVRKYHPTKYLLRWYRRCVLLSAIDGRVLTDPVEPNGGSFTGPSITDNVLANQGVWEPEMNFIVGEYLKALDELPLHFHLHLMHAIEILGYKHPDARIGTWWANVYYRLVRDLHLQPETVEELDARLGDDREAWLARSDPAVTA